MIGPLNSKFPFGIVVPKTKGIGIKIDQNNPSCGWRDLEGVIHPKATGIGTPQLKIFRGNTKGYAFASGDIYDYLIYHMPHDWAGTDLHIHAHWTHNGTAINGNIVLDYRITYAKGHNQGISSVYPTDQTLVHTISTPDVTTYPRYSAVISEIQLSSATPSVGQIDTAILEPDGLIKIQLVSTTIPIVTGGDFFIDYVDIHYQSTEVGTKQKTPNFYE